MYAMMPNFECVGMLDRMNVLKSGVKMPLRNQNLMGLKMISLQPHAYFCQRDSSSMAVSETPSSKPLLL
jgi:hypothetical protein